MNIKLLSSTLVMVAVAGVYGCNRHDTSSGAAGSGSTPSPPVPSAG